MPIALLPIIVQLIQAGITVAPQIIAAAHIELDLLHPDAPPVTAEQMDQLDAALKIARDAVQAALPQDGEG